MSFMSLIRSKFFLLQIVFLFFSEDLFAHILVLTGPSGVGKTTIAEHLLAKYPFIRINVSCTTRNPRKNEIPGKDYIFLSKERFKQLIQENAFFEWTFANDHYYGSLKEQIDENLRKNLWPIKIVNADGFEALRKTFGSCVKVIYIKVSSESELRTRLEKRGTETHKEIEQRLKNGAVEVAAIKSYDLCVENEDLDSCFSKIDDYISKLQKNTK